MLLSRYSIIATARGASIASTSSPDVSGSATKQPTSKLGLYMTTATDLINDTSAGNLHPSSFLFVCKRVHVF